MTTIYMFHSLNEKLVEKLSLMIPIISNENVTIMFIDDFTTLDEDFQEVLFEYEVEEK